MAIRRNSPGVKAADRHKLATEAAFFLASRLRGVGIDVRVIGQEHAQQVRFRSEGGEQFSVADMQKLSYVWNGGEVSLAAFARAFMKDIKQKDRTLEDANRIAEAYIRAVAENPQAHIPALKAENMSHARYFILRDGSVFGPGNPLWESPEYETQRGLYRIYAEILGEEGMGEYLRLVDPSRLRSEEENGRFLEMERRVNGSRLMQRTLENNAERISGERVRAVRNIIQYFDGNGDYLPVEKALLLKGSMTWGVVDKKEGEAASVRLVRITDSNDVCVPVVGGDMAAVAEGLRHGMDYKDALRESLRARLEKSVRSVPRNFSGWKRYPKSGSEDDAAVLSRDVAGTGWCTGSALSTARSHLRAGDFHVYYENGEPLIAIRTEDGRMAEPPRGAHEGQFCTEREEQIAFDYIRGGNGIVAGDDYVNDILDLRRIMSPEATWRDAFAMPNERRYENGEFGGDTKSWGVAAEGRVRELLLGNSTKKRKAEGYYLAKEVKDMIREGHDLSSVKFIRGELVLEKGIYDFRNLQRVGLHLIVEEGVSLRADALQSVEGSLDVREGASLQADALRSVGESLDVCEGASLQADALRSVGWSLAVGEGGSLRANALQSVGGFLTIPKNGSLQLDALQSVGENLEVCAGAFFQADALQRVGGILAVGEGGSLRADALRSVKGTLWVKEDASLKANALRSVGRIMLVHNGASVEANALECVRLDMRIGNGASVEVNALKRVGREVEVSEGASLKANALQSVGGSLLLNNGASSQASIGAEFSLRDGTVYGFAVGDVIYLTPEGVNPDTPIHEYAHLWTRVLEKESPRAWEEVVEGLRESREWNAVCNDPAYSNIRSNDSAIASEVLARLSGRMGADLLEQSAMRSDGTVYGTVAEFRKMVDDRVMTKVFGTDGCPVSEKVTLSVLKDFAEGRRNSLVMQKQKPALHENRFRFTVKEPGTGLKKSERKVTKKSYSIVMKHTLLLIVFLLMGLPYCRAQVSVVDRSHIRNVDWSKYDVRYNEERDFLFVEKHNAASLSVNERLLDIIFYKGDVLRVPLKDGRVLDMVVKEVQEFTDGYRSVGLVGQRGKTFQDEWEEFQHHWDSLKTSLSERRGK